MGRFVVLCLACTCFQGVAVGGESTGIATKDPAPARNRALADKLVDEGLELQKGQQTTAALAKYLAALEADPDHVKALYEIGWSYYLLERWQDVVNTWSRVLELQPDHEAARFLLEAKANVRVTAYRFDSPHSVPSAG